MVKQSWLAFLCVALILVMCTSTTCALQWLQFQSKKAPSMCAAGKSSWTGAIGSGPFHLQPCKIRSRVNRNTVFQSYEALDPKYSLLKRFNEKRQPFCLTNFGGPLPALAFQSNCIIVGGEQMWDLSKGDLIYWHDTDYCWDTLGASQAMARITLSPCNTTNKSQQFRRIVQKSATG